VVDVGHCGTATPGKRGERRYQVRVRQCIRPGLQRGGKETAILMKIRKKKDIRRETCGPRRGKKKKMGFKTKRKERNLEDKGGVERVAGTRVHKKDESPR